MRKETNSWNWKGLKINCMTLECVLLCLNLLEREVEQYKRNRGTKRTRSRTQDSPNREKGERLMTISTTSEVRGSTGSKEKRLDNFDGTVSTALYRQLESFVKKLFGITL
jgi:hypothetical protein